MTKKKDNNYYVYVHRKKTNGEVFYVGKGKGRRAWRFHDRNRLWKRTNDKYGCIVEIVQNNLQEWYALELEIDLVLKHGRVDNNTGTLTNLTDGGEGFQGCVQSEESRKRQSVRMSGRGSPVYNHEVVEFINVKTQEEFTGTRNEFKLYTGLSSYNIFHKHTRHAGGWIVKGSLNDREITPIISGFKGTYNTNSVVDRNIYSFINIDTLQELTCSRLEFYETTGVLPNQLFSKRVHRTVYKWALKSVFEEYGADFLRSPISKTKHYNADKNIYTFINLNDDSVFIGTRLEFVDKYKINPKDLFGKSYLFKHWILEGTNMANVKTDYIKYNFIHIDGRTYKGTRQAFKLEFDVDTSTLFYNNVQLNKSCKGWSLLK